MLPTAEGIHVPCGQRQATRGENRYKANTNALINCEINQPATGMACKVREAAIKTKYDQMNAGKLLPNQPSFENLQFLKEDNHFNISNLEDSLHNHSQSGIRKEEAPPL